MFDISEGRDALCFAPGSGSRCVGMLQGESNTVTVPADRACGATGPPAHQAIPHDPIPPDVLAEPGTHLQMQAPDGRGLPVVVAEASGTHLAIDANHPLAARDLTFAFRIVAVACRPRRGHQTPCRAKIGYADRARRAKPPSWPSSISTIRR